MNPSIPVEQPRYMYTYMNHMTPNDTMWHHMTPTWVSHEYHMTSTWVLHLYHICVTFVSHDLTWSHMTSHFPSAWTPYQWGRISHRTPPPQAQWALSWWRHSMIWCRHGGHCYWWLLRTRSAELMLYSFSITSTHMCMGSATILCGSTMPRVSPHTN